MTTRIVKQLRTAVDHFLAPAHSRPDWYEIYTLLRVAHAGMQDMDGIKRRHLRAVKRARNIAQAMVDGHVYGPLTTVPAMVCVEEVADALADDTTR